MYNVVISNSLPHILSGKPIVVLLVIKFVSVFIELGSSFQCLQDTATGMYPKSNESSKHLYKSHIFQAHCNIILLSVPECFRWSLSFRCSDQNDKYQPRRAYLEQARPALRELGDVVPHAGREGDLRFCSCLSAAADDSL